MRDARRWCGLKLVGWTLVAWGLLAATAAQALTEDLTSQFLITRTGLVLNRATNTFDSTVTLKNASGAPVLAPIDVAVGGLPSGVTLANKAGDKSDGRPYVSPMAPGALLANGSSLSFALKFANPSRATFTSTLQVLRTIEAPPNAPSLLGVVATGGTTARLLGRVEGAANQDVTLQLASATQCVAGTLVSAIPGATVTARTDDQGYFGVNVAGVNPGAYVALKTTAANALSLCQVSSRDNDSWPKAFPLDTTNLTGSDFIDSPNKARWYKIAITPGQRIQVVLSNLPADYDLAVFKDIGQAFANQFNPATAGVNDLVRLAAEFAPSTFSPSTFSPSTFSPDAYTPSTFSPSTFSPSLFAPSTFSPSTFSPSTFSPSTLSPSTFSPSTFSPSTFSPSTFSPSIYTATEIEQAFSTAQTKSIISVAVTPGTGSESTVVNTWNSTGDFYIRVVGRNGAFNTTTPFTVSVTKGPTTCTGVTDITLSPRSQVAASGLKTVILTDSSKVELDSELLVAGGGTLRAKLSAFASRAEIQGVVVDVAGDSRVSTLKQQAANNPACPFAKNLVAEEIKGIVDTYRANPLQYIVIVGNDDAVPFFRTPDQTPLGQESTYVPPVESNSTSEASLRRDFVLSQDAYGSRTKLSLPATDFQIPGLAVGRLIETTTEIAGILDAYVAANGVVLPSTSLVTGYDFLEDAANAVRDELQLGTGGVPDTLITPNGKSPQDPASWTAAQLGSKLLGARHDVIFLAGHFSAVSALAADFSTNFLSTELAASSVDLTNSIVFSAGCHSGYNLVDAHAIAGVTMSLDWAQAFARKKATLIAGTGYQYGDTDFLEYSERLYKNFARRLRAGTGPQAVGEALVQAKLDYLATTPDIRGIHEKALLEATLFGLPMLGVNMPSGRGAPAGTGGVITPVPVAAGPAATLGLRTFDFQLTPTLTPRTIALKNVEGGPDVVATWLDGPDGVVTKPSEPALPLAAVNVTPTDPNVVLRGVGFRGGNYVDSPPIIPFSGAPTTELRSVHGPFNSPVFFPARMWTPNYFGALTGAGGTQLLVTPAQHRAVDFVAGTSTQRKFTGLNLRLYYSGDRSKAALSNAPSIVGVEALRSLGDVQFTVQVIGDPAAAIHQVWITFAAEGGGTWSSLDLVQCVRPAPAASLPPACGTTDDSRLWKGRLTSAPANLKYIVQAANGIGLVALDDNLGSFYGVGAVVPVAPVATTLALVSPPASATIGATVNVKAALAFGGVALANKPVLIGIGGVAHARTTGADGSATVAVPVAVNAGNYLITASFAGDDAYLPSSVTAPFQITKPTTNLVGLASAGVTLTGVVDGVTQVLQRKAVRFTVNGPGGTTTIWADTDYLGRAVPPTGLPGGNYSVTSAAYDGDAMFAAANVTFGTPQQFTVAKTAQSLTFDPLADTTIGSPAVSLFATASSGLPVGYGASGACSVAGNLVTLGGVGSCTITASQPGDAVYAAATNVIRSFSIAAGTGPTVSSLVRAVPNPTMADSVTYTLTFSEAVTGVTSANFAVAMDGITAASVGGISGGGTTWTVTVNTGRGTGTLHLDVANGTGITNTGGTPLTGAPFTGEPYQIDKGGTLLGVGEGQLVTGFGNGGYALFNDGPLATTPGRIRVRSDGRILAAGGIGCAALVPSDPLSPFYCTLQLAQYSASGAPDASFGTNGRVVTAVTSVNAEVNLRFNSDGSFFASGFRYNGANNVPYVARFTSAGTPDPSFGTNGVVSLDSLPLGFGVIGSTFDGSGRFIFVGTTLDTGTGEREDIFVTRLTSSGATDTTFGTNGVAQFALSSVDDRSDRGSTFDVQPDGKIVIGGRTKVTSGVGYDFFLMRLDETGVRDPSFGINGVATTRFPGSTGDNLGRRLALQPDGKLALMGTVTIGTAMQCGIAQWGANGVLDSGFGTGGRVLVGMSGGCFGVYLQSDGKLIVTGNDRIGDVNYGSFARVLRTGALDPTFGTGGVLDISNFDTPTRVQVTSSGNILTGLTIQDPADGVLKAYVVELSGTLAGPYLPQSINFGALPDRAFGEFFNVSATASSGLAVSFTASGVCSVDSNVVHLTGLGNCTITAHQTGNATYFAATPVARTFAVSQANQVLTFGPAPTGVTAEQLLVTVTASSSSPNAPPSMLPITFTSLTPSVCMWGGFAGSSVTFHTAGTCTIAANQAGNAFYNPAPQATLNIPVGAALPPPDTYLVSSLADSGPNTLRAAIEAANIAPGANAISFSVTGTIHLTSGQIQISGPVLITGPGADQLTINGSGNDNGRIFSIFATDPACPALDGPDYLVSISGLTLANGRRGFDNSGGAIFTEHSLALDSVIVRNSTAVRGGGVSFQIQYPGQTLNITNSKFLDNIATELAAPGTNSNTASGGGLNVQDRCTGPANTVTDLPSVTPVTVTIANSEFRGNSSRPLTLSARGGGIRFYSYADVTISDTVIAENYIDTPNPPTAGRTYNGGGLNVAAKSLRIERSEISENDVFDPTVGDATRSGGLHVGNDAVTRQGSGNAMAVKIVNSTISGNTVSATGGAMLAYGNAAVSLENSTVSDNAAGPTRTGGIIVTGAATYPVSANNTSRPTLSVVSSILANNSSTGGDLVGNVTTLPTFTVNATNSLIERICATAGCSAMTVVGSGNLTSVGATPGPDPLLGPLAHNGGTSRTHALLAGSPAINTGGNPFGLTTDQRGAGFLRVVEGAADMGAYESGGPPVNHAPVANAGSHQNDVIVGQSVQLNGTCTDVDNDVTTRTWSFVSKPAGSNSALSNATLLNPTFTPDLPGSYQLQLICNDGQVDSSPSLVSITTSIPEIINVTSTNDSGQGSLRDAIALANLGLGPNTITFAPGMTGTILLTTGQIRIEGPLAIVGPGSDVLALDGNLNGRIFTIIENNAPACPALSGPSDYLVSISGLTLKNGSRNVADSGGGAIQTSKSLVLNDVTIRDSQAKGGGGLAFNAQYPGQVLSITDSQFIDNVAKPVVAGNTGSHLGGAIRIGDACPNTWIPAVVAISTSTFIGNRVQPVELSGAGGAIGLRDNSSVTISDTLIEDNHAEPNTVQGTGHTSVGGAISAMGTFLTIERSEIADNSAVFAGALWIAAPALAQQPPGSTYAFLLINSTVSDNTGGVVLWNHVSAELYNSTIAYNAGPGISYGIFAEGSPTLDLVSSIVSHNGFNGMQDVDGNAPFTIDATNSLVRNVCGTCSITVSGSGNLAGVDPLLGPLAYNGGPTRTRALLAGSPAINTGSNPLALTTDQRGAGFLRVVGGTADMGAYESGQTGPLSNFAYASQFGTSGSGNGQFALPYGIAINPTNHLIAVTDYSLRRVQVFNSAGVYVSQFGSSGTGNGQFAFPAGIAFDATNGNIVVADSGNNRVQIFSQAGSYLSQFGTAGSGAGQMSQPYGVAVDPVTRNIVVTDGNNRRVQLYDSTGSFLGQFGSNGTGNGQFNVPFGVAIDPTTRDIVVSDYALNRVQIFTSGGAYLSQFGSAGTGNGQFQGASGVAIDPTTRNIFVTDYNNSRVQVFSSAGVYLSQFGAAGTGNGQFSGGTYGVAIDPTSHNAVVTDVSNIRVQVFAPQ